MILLYLLHLAAQSTDNSVEKATATGSTDIILENIKTYLELDVNNSTSLTFQTPTSTFVGNGYITILNGANLTTFGTNTSGLDTHTFTTKDTLVYFILDGMIYFKEII